MKHIHTRFSFIQDLVFRKVLTMSSVKTDVNPSAIGTEALRRERFHRLRSMPGAVTELSETTSSPGSWGRKRVTQTSCKQNVCWFGRVERSTHVSERRFCGIFCNEGRLPNLAQPRDARRRACGTRAMLLHSWSHHSLLQQTQHDMLLTLRRLGPKSGDEKIARMIHCAQRS